VKDDIGTADQPELFGPLALAAEATLADVLGHPIRFANVERLSEAGRRNLILRLRCLNATAGDGPANYIIKKVETEQHSPQFYGGNRDLGFIVLEDLGHHRSLVDPLLHAAAASAEKALFRYSACLGKLHADTIDRQPCCRLCLGFAWPASSPEPLCFGRLARSRTRR
jgi:hypothetical protein